MARIVNIGKYPPIQGGIAAKTFWLTRALAKRGHEIHIICDDCGVSAEYSCRLDECQENINNLYIHRPLEKTPWHIPNDPHRAFALLDLALSVIHDSKPDIIDTGYLIPYGIVGYMASLMTGVPFIIRHGGSDIRKFVEPGIWRHLIGSVFREAPYVVSDPLQSEIIRKLRNHVIDLPPYVPDPEVFKPLRQTYNKKPVLALIGKANYHWQHKSWDRAIEIMEHLGDTCSYLVIAQGLGLKDFKSFVLERLGSKVKWQDFVHPEKMPKVLNSVDGIFLLHGNMPYPSFSNLSVEAMYCGTVVITDKANLVEEIKNCGINVEFARKRVLSIHFISPALAAERILDYFHSNPPDGDSELPDPGDFEQYIAKNEEILCSMSREKR